MLIHTNDAPKYRVGQNIHFQPFFYRFIKKNEKEA